MISLKLLQSSTERLFTRSSGPGGQHVNKTSSKVQLTFDILSSELSDHQKQRLLKKFPSGFIRVVCQDTRSQYQNTKLGFLQLQKIVDSTLRRKKLRKRTKAPYLTKSGKKKILRKKNLLKYKRRSVDV